MADSNTLPKLDTYRSSHIPGIFLHLLDLPNMHLFARYFLIPLYFCTIVELFACVSVLVS